MKKRTIKEELKKKTEMTKHTFVAERSLCLTRKEREKEEERMLPIYNLLHTNLHDHYNMWDGDLLEALNYLLRLRYSSPACCHCDECECVYQTVCAVEEALFGLDLV